MKTKTVLGIFILILIFLVGTTVRAQDNTNTNTKNNKSKTTTTTKTEKSEWSKKSTAKSEDEDFIKEAASGGLMEVELGKIAQQNGQDPRVTAFGAMMVRDHSKANTELKSVASMKNVDVSAMKDEHRDNTEKMKDKNGADFDKEYMKMMVKDHEKDIDAFKKEATDGKDPDVRNFASKTLPVLLMHLDSAKAIQSSIERK